MTQTARVREEYVLTCGETKIGGVDFNCAEHCTVEELKTSMLEMATLVGGRPPRGYTRLDECFTFEPELNALILWYNVDGTTKAVIRHIEETTSLVH